MCIKITKKRKIKSSAQKTIECPSLNIIYGGVESKNNWPGTVRNYLLHFKKTHLGDYASQGHGEFPPRGLSMSWNLNASKTKLPWGGGEVPSHTLKEVNFPVRKTVGRLAHA